MKNSLRRALDNVRDALDGPLDSDERDALASVAAEIESMLELSSEVARVDRASMHASAVTTREQFQERYPRLAAALGRLADTLVSIGI